jgi:hypothetical protein
MKVSAVKDMIDKIVAEYGDFEIGDPKDITVSRGSEGWICGWSARVIRHGIHVGSTGMTPGKFVGTELVSNRERDEDGFGYAPKPGEMGPETVRTCLP